MPIERIVAGRYRLLSKLSEGGMGSVWRAQHLDLDCPAAVKLLDPRLAESPEALARFKREAQSAASLRSTNIVQILDFGLDNGVPYIAMELLQGQTLATKLTAQHHLPPQETAIILSQVARAVTWAHDMGIIHRDLKPGNIFLSNDAGEIVVKLLDFGIAKPVTLGVGDVPVTITGMIVGTPQYMSPEQASGRGAVDHRTDIWSFGIVAYECLTGQRAFAADTLGGLMLSICSDPLPVPSDVAPVPRGFDEWFARCAHRDPGRRFLSIDEASDVLRFVCGLEVGPLSGVPKLYSEPPPRLTPRGPMQTPIQAWNVRTRSATDAPATLSVIGTAPHRSNLPKLAIYVALFLAGSISVALLGSTRGAASHSRGTAAAGIGSALDNGAQQTTKSPAASNQPIVVAINTPEAPNTPNSLQVSKNPKPAAESRKTENNPFRSAQTLASVNHTRSTNPTTPETAAAARAPSAPASQTTPTVESVIGLKRTGPAR